MTASPRRSKRVCLPDNPEEWTGDRNDRRSEARHGITHQRQRCCCYEECVTCEYNRQRTNMWIAVVRSSIPTYTPISASCLAAQSTRVEADRCSFLVRLFHPLVLIGLSGTRVPTFGTVTALEIGLPIDRISNRLL